MVFWIDATSESSFLNQNGSSDISDNDTVSSWQDSNILNGNGKKSCVQATQANQPTYVGSGINGLPSIRYNQTVNSMRLICSLDNSINVEGTIFIILKWVSSANAFGATNFLVIDGSNNLEIINSINTSGNLTFLNWNGASNVDILSYNSLKSGENLLLTRHDDPNLNSSALYLNGTNVSTATASLGGILTDVTISVGNYPNATRTLGGDIGEIIIFDRALKTEERKSVEQYLGKKWGIKVS